MFGISWSEMLIILAVALVVIGPADLPRVLYSAGKFFRNVRRFTDDIQKSIDGIMREEELADIVREANLAGGDNLQFELDKQVQIEAARRAGAQAGGPDIIEPAKPKDVVPQVEKKPEDGDATG